MVHERIFVDGEAVGDLRHHMLHYSYRNVDEFYASDADKYARLSAEEYKQDGSKKRRSNPLNELLHLCWTFFARIFFAWASLMASWVSN